MVLQYTLPFEAKAGTVEKVLLKSYDSLIKSDPVFKVNGTKNFKETEANIFKYPDTVGLYCFLSWFDGNVVGFFSYDPRPMPYRCIVGHNCIDPEYRRRGFGKLQILEILKQGQDRDVENIDVTTCDHPFYVPAQKMYESCGFVEVDRNQWDDSQGCYLINYRIKMKT